MNQKTVLHPRHVQLGGRMVPFAGWLLPVQYEGVLAEHAHCRRQAAVFDTSHMGQLLISGPRAAEALSRVGTQDAPAMPTGRCRYGFLLNERGGVLDDAILMRLAEDRFLLVVNAGTRADDVQWLRGRLGREVDLLDRTAEGWGKIDLQGPRSFEVLSPLVDAELGALRYFRVVAARCAGRECLISRTGYTGELGYEIMAPGEALVVVFDALLAVPAVKPAGLGARDSLRLEMGYPLYGHELDADHTPLEAGLAAFLELDRDYVGAEALRTQAREGLARSLVAFRADTRRRSNPGDAILRDGRAVGTVTSGGFAPSLGVSIGMGYVPPELASPSTRLTVDTGRAKLDVTVASRPLYHEGTCRAPQPAEAGRR